MGVIEAVGASYMFVSAMLAIMADEECEADSFCYMGKRYGEKGIVTLCRVPFVIVTLPIIFGFYVVFETLPERERAKEWLFTEREEA